MKRALVVLVVAALVIGGVLFIVRRGPSGPSNTKPFEAKATIDSSNVGFYTDNDTLYSLIAGGAFYKGTHALPGGGDREFEDARAKKIEEIGKLAQETVERVGQESESLAALRSALLQGLQKARGLEPKVMPFASTVFKNLVALEARRMASSAAFKALSASNTKDAFSKATTSEAAALAAADAGLAHVDELQAITAYAAATVAALEDHPKAASAAKEIDSAMGEMDDAARRASEIAEKVNAIRFGFNQLETADHYYARAVSEHLKAEIPKLEAALKKAKPRAHISEADLKFGRAYLGLFKKWQSTMEKHLDKVPSGALIKVAMGPAPSFGLAFADGEAGSSSYSKAYQALGEIGSGAYDVVSGTASATWNGLKTIGRAGQRTVQLGADTAGFFVKSSTRFWDGAFRHLTGQPGSSLKEIKADMNEWENELKENWRGRIPKQTTLRTAKEYLDGVDKGAEATGKWIGSAGGNAAAWVMGKTAKVVAGVFTGLGKGIAAVSDPSSSTSELVEGGLDIAFAAIGGSKVLIKGSQIPGLVAGAGQEAKLAGQMGIEYLKRRRAKDELEILRQVLAERSAKDLTGLLSNLGEIAGRNASLEALEAAIAAMRAEMAALAKAGGKALGGNLASMKSSWDDLFKKNLKGISENLATAMGTTPVEVLDSVFGGTLDDLLKEGIAGLAESPKIEEIAGTYKGNLTFTTLKLDEKGFTGGGLGGCLGDSKLSPEQAKAAAKQFEQALLDKPLPVNFIVTVTGERSGELRIVSAGQKKAQEIAFQYFDGTMTAEVVQDGSDVKLNATFSMRDGATVLTGDIAGSEASGSAKATMKGSKGG